MQTDTTEQGPATTDVGASPERLLSEYLAIVNRVLRREDDFWYEQAKQLNRAILGEADFRTIVYDDDPDVPAGEFTIHFDPNDREVSLRPPGEYDTTFSWKASMDYLRDVVLTRPDWYLEHPTALDWNWFTDRIGDEAEDAADDGSSMLPAAGALALGAAVGAISTAVLKRRG